MMPSATRNATSPWQIPPNLHDRLGEIAAKHDGLVPLHGRLFAQWLHHVYPLECPYPHEAGTTNPAAWTGQDSEQLTEDEIMDHLASDTCSVDLEGRINCGEESAELPWSMEEILLTGPSTHDVLEAEDEFIVIVAIAMISALGLGLAAMRGSRSLDGRSSIIATAAVLLAVLAVYCGLLDLQIMAAAAASGTLLNLLNRRYQRSTAAKLPTVAK